MSEDQIKELWKRLHKIRIQMDESWISKGHVLDAQALLDELEGHILRCGSACDNIEDLLCNFFPDWAKEEGYREGGEG